MTAPAEEKTGEYGKDDIYWSDLFEQVHADIKLGMNCTLLLLPDKLGEEFGRPGRWYFQVECQRPDSTTGEMGTGRGGKAYLSPNMTESELVQCAYGLYQSYWIHEARETFEYYGRKVFGPHISIKAHWNAAEELELRAGDR